MLLLSHIKEFEISKRLNTTLVGTLKQRWRYYKTNFYEHKFTTKRRTRVCNCIIEEI